MQYGGKFIGLSEVCALLVAEPSGHYQHYRSGENLKKWGAPHILFWGGVNKFEVKN